MELDLESMSKDELVSLKRNVDKALVSFEKRQKDAALAAAQKAAQEHGFSLEEIFGKRGSTKTSIPKYRNPADSSQTWSGRGRQPVWYKDAIAGGATPEELAV